MPETIAGVTIPDTDLAREATALVREAADDLLVHHSRRVYLWGMLQSAHLGIEVDPELAYVGAMFHDLGLTQTHRTTNHRFEIDGADVAKRFLLDHGHSAEQAQAVWLAIALHTTPEVPLHLTPETAVVTRGVETDVLGLGIEVITPAQREAVLAAHPRHGFKHGIVQAFYAGIAHRPDTTFGTMNDDVLAHVDPSFRRADFVNIIMGSAWAE